MKKIKVILTALFAGARVPQGFKFKQGNKWGYGQLLTDPGYHYMMIPIIKKSF